MAQGSKQKIVVIGAGVFGSWTAHHLQKLLQAYVRLCDRILIRFEIASLARQQIFDMRGEIESDIVYGAEGNLTNTADYARLPLQIVVTRPQEKYSMKLTYQSPEAVTIGKTYPASAFVLENTWDLQEVDLDKKLQEATAGRPLNTNQNTATTKFQ